MEEKKGFFAEFKEFISRGNVMDMAVGVVVGGAFTAIVNALVESIIKPLIILISGKAGVSDVADVTVGIFPIGLLISAIINFLLISFVVFLLVKSINDLKEKSKKKEEEKKEEAKEEEPAGPTEAELLSEIRDLLKAQQDNK